MVPCEYDWPRHCVTTVGWEDPRGLNEDAMPLITVAPSGERVPRDTAAQIELERRQGELFWPERFGHAEISRIKAELGPYLASGRLQRMPGAGQGRRLRPFMVTRQRVHN
jgi:hypothetical protein